MHWTCDELWPLSHQTKQCRNKLSMESIQKASDQLSSPAELAFGYDLIFWQKYINTWSIGNDWKCFAQGKQLKSMCKRIIYNWNTNIRLETRVFIIFKPYKQCKNLMISLSTPHARGPYCIKHFFAHWTVKIQCSSYEDVVLIHRITLYHPR